ncbi:CCG-binding protein 1 [Glycine max]|nr:CCG-binding protein 1 [Glycine max]
MKATLLRPCSGPLILDTHSNRTSSTMRHASTVVCCSSKNQPYIPKLEPFSRTKFERAVKDPPLIEKSEKEILESPRADIERLILETGGVKSLIGCLHGISIMHKVKKGDMNLSKDVKSEEGERMCPIPDGLPKSADELREEEQARMPDSPYTKLLRTMGRHPAWYSPAPDHETD